MASHAPLARAEVFYGIQQNGNGIYSVDTLTGGPATLLWPLNFADNTTVTLATRPSDGMLFYLDSRAANPNLWRWDPANPASAPVLLGTPGPTTTNVIRLGFDSVGNLFAMNSGASTSLWRLDPDTGAILSVVPASGFNGGNLDDGGDLCLHPTSGVLYMVAQQRLYTITSAGVVTLVGTMTGLTGDPVTGCAFAGDSSLVVSPATAATGNGQLYRVNIGTLAAVAMPNTTGVSGFGDLASSPGRAADLSVTKTASNSAPGNTVSFTVTVSNAGPDRASDVRILDLLPPGLTFVSATASKGAYSATAVVGPPAYPGGTWRVGTLNNGATATLTINATVTNVAIATNITNWAQVSHVDQYDRDSQPGSASTPSPAGQDDQASATITPSPDLRTVKTATSSFAVGTNATYSITVNNSLGSMTTGTSPYTVTDVLPAGLTFVSAAGIGWTCAPNVPAAGDNVAGGSRMACTSSATMLAGASNASAIVLTVLPGAAAAPSVVNTATVSGGGEPFSNNGNNSSTVTTSVCTAGGCPDLIISKTSAPSFTVGVNAAYTLTVSNIGGLSTAGTYSVSDTLPAGLTFVSATGTAWACSAAGQVVTCTRLANLAAGTPAVPTAAPPITLTVSVGPSAAPGVNNTASVAGGGEQSPQNNNSASLTTPVIDFDLTISKTSAASFTLGANAAYTLTVSNIGGKATSGIITVTDTLPAGLAFVSGTGTGWTACTASGQLVTCTRSAANIIALGSAATPTAAPAITLTVAVGAAAASAVSNTASVSNPNESANLLGNNSSSVTTPVNAPDLIVTKSHNGNFAVGVNGIYALTVSNIGALTTSTADVVVTDNLPVGLRFVSGAGTGWTCTAAAVAAAAIQPVTCTRTAANAIAANSSSDPITLTVSVAAAPAGASPASSVTNNVSVAGGNEPANNAANNSDSDLTFIYYAPVITKAFSPATITAGGTSTLTLTIGNPAGNPLSLAGLAVVDPFPAGMSVATGPALTNTCGGIVSPGNAAGDTLLSLTGGATGAAGTSCSISVAVTSVTTGANLNTTGQVTSSNSGTGNAASATLTVTAPGSPILTKLSAPNPVGVNQPSTLTFTITNKATLTNDMGFTDSLPTGVVISTPNGLGGTCTSTTGGALVRTATAGGNSIVVSGIDMAAAAAPCTVTVNIQSATVGSYLNNSARISALAGGLTAASLSDTLIVQATTLTKAFAPSTIAVNTPSTLTFTITNGADAPSQNGLAFTETLPSGVVVTSAPNATQCSGTVAATVNTGVISLSGGALAAGQTSCSIVVSVTSATAGTYDNLPANVTGVSANIVNNATATLTVGTPSLTFLKTVAVFSDPVNGGTNPKNIPGATVDYTLRVTNSGDGTVTANTIIIIDPIPANTDLFLGDLGATPAGPVAFTSSTAPASGLSFTAANASFFSDAACSLAIPAPTPPYDASVRCLRLNPQGAMAAASGGNNPFIDFRFRVRLR